MKLHSLLIAACGALLGLAAHAASPGLMERLPHLDRSTAWKQTAAIAVQFPSFHPQGMVKIGEDFYFSTVEIRTPTKRFAQPQGGYDRDTGEGAGYLYRMDKSGKLLASLPLGEGSVYHPGGLDFDGRYIWVPVAEYRPNSRSIIYRVDPATMKAEEVFRFNDHIGGIVHNTDDGTLHGVSWGSRRLYTWPLDTQSRPTNLAQSPEQLRKTNRARYIDYQDCHYLGGAKMLCAGLNNYRTAPDAMPFRLGGMEVVDLRTLQPLWQTPVELWSPRGLPMTQNPFWVEPSANGVRAYFMPDDDKSTLFVYEAVTP